MSAPRYPKIDSLFERDENFKVDETKIRREEFTIPSEWVVTEKIDGMNIRVSLEFTDCQDCFQEDCEAHEDIMGDWVVKYYGRGENSQFPPQMLEHLQKTFTLNKMGRLWKCKSDCEKCEGKGHMAVADDLDFYCPDLNRYQITLYGEGYGAGIQKGGGYNKDKTFRLFDVLVGETWLSRENVEDVAKQLDIFCAPILDKGVELDMIIEYVRTGISSEVANQENNSAIFPAEGIVAQTVVPLFNSRGQRLMFKLKTKDFA